VALPTTVFTKIMDSQYLFDPTNTHCNPGLLRIKDHWLMPHRVGFWHNKLGLTIWDNDFERGFPMEIKTAKLPSKYGPEDPRIFRVGNQIYLAYCWRNSANNGNRINLGVLDPGRLKLSNEVTLDYPGSRQDEKNWTFFDDKGKMKFINQFQPTTMLQDIAGNVGKYKEVIPGVKWHDCTISGSTPAILKDGEYYSVFHAVHQEKKNSIRNYWAGMVTFKLNPFQLLRISKVPMLKPPDRKPFGEKFPTSHHVVFPCGLQHYEEKWYVSYGLHDIKCVISAYSQAEIDNHLVPFPLT
jgi:predicted GH43/DUF377 family glycosyl hydrolase